MNKYFALFVTIFVLSALNLFAQTASTPSKGSPVRKAVLDALRIPVERELKQKVVFSVDTMKVQGAWAFANGSPLNTNNETPNYRGTRYQEAIDSEAFDNNFQALLKKTGSKWKVVTYAIGCTDVCWYGWWTKYKAPKSIFPATD